jgi:hypothetical protein
MDRTDQTRLERVEWKSPPLAGFRAMMREIEARFGEPSARDLDSNGIGPFDCHLIRFACGLEVALWRFHWTSRGPIDALVEPSYFEIYSHQRDLEHIGFHIGVPPAAMDLSRQGDTPIAPALPHRFQVVREDDHLHQFIVQSFSNRCEAEAVADEYQRRGHHQSYWVEEI